MSRRKALLSITALLLPSVSAQVQQYNGCYSSSAPLVNQGYWQYQAEGYCEPLCSGQGAAVYALSDAAYCWCGNELPAESSLVSDSSCSLPCAGYPSNNCGGNGFYSVWLTGLSLNVQHYGGGGGGHGASSASSNPAAPTSSSPKHTTAKGPPHRTTRTHASVVTATAPGTTIVQTIQGGQPTGQSSSNGSNGGSGNTNIVGIAVGVVVGIVGAAALIGSVVYYLRRRKQRDIEEEHKRHTQVANLRSGDRRLSMTGYSQMSDSRLDPVARENRNSHGSIADNQDYSRRILRVANPDST